MSERRFASVWGALEESPAEAANLKMRSDLMIASVDLIDGWGTSSATAAERLGISESRLDDLMRGRISKLSLDALIDIATRAGLAVRLEVDRPAA